MSILEVIYPDWPAPSRVKALVTTRKGGDSLAPFDSFNVGLHVGDVPEKVLQNRRQLQQLLATKHEPQWLEQVHGRKVVEAHVGAQVPQADASFTSVPELPCAVMTADCLPVLFCTENGDQVAAAHAGWRGLAAGVLEATLEMFPLPASEVMAWLGPAIGPQQFEVGQDVLDAFLSFSAECEQAFTPHPLKPQRWVADIYQLARLRLKAKGVVRIFGGDFCTFSERERFFSYRRDGVTGRMASLIWINE